MTLVQSTQARRGNLADYLMGSTVLIMRSGNDSSSKATIVNRLISFSCVEGLGLRLRPRLNVDTLKKASTADRLPVGDLSGDGQYIWRPYYFQQLWIKTRTAHGVAVSYLTHLLHLVFDALAFLGNKED